jgi:LysR family transcriptional regulator AphB
MIDLNDMVIFAKVAETGGISAAAKALKVPKSKVSRRLAMLEAALGVRLLERSTRSFNVTESGLLYLQHCQRIVEEANSAQDSIQQLVDMPRGNLRISASIGVGQYLIAPHLSEFMQQYPEIDLDVDLNNRRVDPISEGFDLVIRVGQLNDSNLISKRFGTSQAALYASPDYLKQQGFPKSLADLSTHKTIVMSDANPNQQWILENKKGLQSVVDVRSKLSINDFSCLRTVVKNGGGIGLFPHYFVADLLQSGQLQQVLSDWGSSEISYYVLYPSRRGLTRKAKVWIEFFAHKLKQAIHTD